MTWKKIAAAAAISIVVVAAVWTYLVTTYETQLGTSNVILANTEGSASDSHNDNSLIGLNFDDGAEDLLYSSLEINLLIEGETYGCSFGSQSNSDSQNGKVSPNLERMVLHLQL